MATKAKERKRTPRLSRRSFLAAGLALGAGAVVGEETQSWPPVRVITRGPKHHWFGYYDKLQFDPTSRYVLGMEVDFEHRSPGPEDKIAVGMVDTADSDRWIVLGHSTAWCWQQGCMLQWLPGQSRKIIWNDRENGAYVARILDLASGERRTVERAIYAVSPDGRFAVCTDFHRLADTRPGYGYNGIPDPFADDPAPAEAGIYRVDLETGASRLILSYFDVMRFGPTLATMEGAKHKFNHLLFSPTGERFVFLHRWKGPKGRETRMLTADLDGRNLRVVDANGLTSHFIWRDAEHILAWSRQPSHGARFYLFRDSDDPHIEVVGPEIMTQDGHCSYLPGNEWILNDTYPDGRRLQRPYLYHVATSRVVPLGEFPSPPEYTGEWRCDTHPRFSPDGKKVVIDSPAPGIGRQLHLIDISRIVG